MIENIYKEKDFWITDYQSIQEVTKLFKVFSVLMEYDSKFCTFVLPHTILEPEFEL